METCIIPCSDVTPNGATHPPGFLYARIYMSTMRALLTARVIFRLNLTRACLDLLRLYYKEALYFRLSLAPFA